jgi:hypothetical protein
MPEKRMKKMPTLSSFGQTTSILPAAKAEPDAAPIETEQPESTAPIVEQPTAPKRTKAAKPKAAERMVTINIKIPQSQQDWLADTARDVRANNDEPVPSSDRVYPQHLVQAAVDLLKSSNVNWAEVRNIKDLRVIRRSPPPLLIPPALRD